MSPRMLHRLGRLIVARPRTILVVTGILTVLAAFGGRDVADHLVAGGFDDPDSEFQQTLEVVEEEFPAGGPNVALLVTAASGDVDAPEVVDVGRALTEDLGDVEGVSTAVSYWSLGIPTLRSTDGTRALVVARINGK